MEFSVTASCGNSPLFNDAVQNHAAREVTIGKEDNGKTFTVQKGDKVILELETNYSTPYRWKVAVTDKSFGYPGEQYIPPDNIMPGAPGKTRFTWDTDTPFAGGTHMVIMQNLGLDNEIADTFEFTVIVKK